MANNVARSFLNDTSLILLESSEGAKNVVKKQQEIKDMEQKAIDTRVDLECLFRNSSDNNKAICELRGIGFFGRLFKKKEIEAKLAKLEGIKRELDNDISATVDRIDLIEKILGRLKTEFAKYSEELAKVGLTPEDIIAEYNLIKQELAEKAQAKTVQSQSAPNQTIATPVQPSQKPKNSRMSQVDKFNMRLAKFNQMNADKQTKSVQESQPE